MNRVISVGAISLLGLAALPEPAWAQRSGTSRPQERPGIARPETVPVTDARKPQGFSVVLVLGDLQGGVTQDNVPPAARKALTDMKEFLPYKSYRLLDVQWTLCCGGGRGATPVVSRLRGPDGHDYELTLGASLEQYPQSRLNVRFALRDPSVPDSESGGSELIRELQLERERLEAEYQVLRQRAQSNYEIGVGRGPEQDPEVRQARLRVGNATIKLAEAKQRNPGTRGVTPGMTPNHPDRIAAMKSRSIIDTSFTMDVGETVVVGTSRLAGGDKALIALLTAVPRTAASR
jgi:hypothetical protein